MENLLRELSVNGSPEATIRALQMEVEKLKWKHAQEIAELKHNAGMLYLPISFFQMCLPQNFAGLLFVW